MWWFYILIAFTFFAFGFVIATILSMTRIEDSNTYRCIAELRAEAYRREVEELRNGKK